jgi:hypothetical protein
MKDSSISFFYVGKAELVSMVSTWSDPSKILIQQRENIRNSTVTGVRRLVFPPVI